MNQIYFYKVAVPARVYNLFDYLLPEDISASIDSPLKTGVRVKVPFGTRTQIGVIISHSTESDFEKNKIRKITEVLDNSPLPSTDSIKLADWAIKYYCGFPGEIVSLCFPALLRQGKKAKYNGQKQWRIFKDSAISKNAKAQQRIISVIKENNGVLCEKSIPEPIQNNRNAIKKLVDNGILTEKIIPSFIKDQELIPNTFTPNDYQQQAIGNVVDSFGSFSTNLLYGVTGSGKTEVFIQLAQKVIENRQQVLILVPEIGLTPQIVKRFRERFSVPVATIHSAMNDSERLDSWLGAKTGDASIIIGTRSALFVPLKNPGLIIIDEEHDQSFKQQDRLRYSARDSAIVRAQINNLPIVLASATPSLESYFNAIHKRFNLLKLPNRAGKANKPKFSVIDMRSQNSYSGLSNKLISTIKKHLAGNNQVLLFLNRRGYAPVLMCGKCNWTSACKRCDVNKTYHHADNVLRCHHCGHEERVPVQCPSCGSKKDIFPLGKGTERIEESLRSLFNGYSQIRIDRDSTSRKGSFEDIIKKIDAREYQIILGTQMLAKGHHFEGVTLVAIIDADSGLFSSDFRALEKLGQMLIQVGGRSGRGDKKGEVVIQTRSPDHPALTTLINYGYEKFCKEQLRERKEINLPPHNALALLRAESMDRKNCDEFLLQIKDLAEKVGLKNNIELYGPIANIITKKRGFYGAHLVIQAQNRPQLQKALEQLFPQITNLKNSKVRWVMDVDPQDVV